MVAVLLLLLALQFVCLGLLALVRFRAAGLVLLCVQLQRFLVVLGVALTVPLLMQSRELGGARAPIAYRVCVATRI